MWSSVAQQPVHTIVSTIRGKGVTLGTAYGATVLPAPWGEEGDSIGDKNQNITPTYGIFFGEENKASGSEEAVNVDVKLNNGISENNKKKNRNR